MKSLFNYSIHIFIIITFCIASSFTKSENLNIKIEEPKILSKEDNIKLLYTLLIREKITAPKIVLAQIILETG